MEEPETIRTSDLLLRRPTPTALAGEGREVVGPLRAGMLYGQLTGRVNATAPRGARSHAGPYAAFPELRVIGFDAAERPTEGSESASYIEQAANHASRIRIPGA